MTATGTRPGACAALLALTLCGPAWSFTGTEGAAFLELPIGARPSGMGSAYTMLAEDAYAPVWNPAGLAFLEDTQIAGMHSVYLESTHYDYFSAAHRVGGRAGIGAAIRYFNPGTIAGVDEFNAPIGDAKGHYADYMLSAGFALTPGISIGATGHVVEASIDGVSAKAIAGTAGLLMRPNDRWRWGAAVANFGQKMRFLESEDPLPLAYRLGGAYHPHPSWTLALEGVREQTGVWSGHGGIEYETPFGFTCRTGYNTERTRQVSPLAGFSVGMSMLIWKQDFAYTWLPAGDLGANHLISVVIHFGPWTTPKEGPQQLKRPPVETDEDFSVDRL